MGRKLICNLPSKRKPLLVDWSIPLLRETGDRLTKLVQELVCLRCVYFFVITFTCILYYFNLVWQTNVLICILCIPLLLVPRCSIALHMLLHYHICGGWTLLLGVKVDITLFPYITFLLKFHFLRVSDLNIILIGKLAKPRQLHNSHWGMMCPAETPEGQVSH
jgi:hypothetical protein